MGDQTDGENRATEGQGEEQQAAQATSGQTDPLFTRWLAKRRGKRWCQKRTYADDAAN